MREVLRKRYFEIVFIILTAAVGITYSLIWGLDCISDAETHYLTSYALADSLMGKAVKKETEDYLGLKGLRVAHFEIRKCDKEYLFETEKKDSSIIYASSVFNKDKSYVMIDQALATYFPFPTYLVDSIGIIIGRVVNLGPEALYYFIRLINLAIYIVVGVVLIRLLPSYKEFIFVMFLLPVCLTRGSSTGHESLNFAYTWLYIFYIVYLAYQVTHLSRAQKILLFLFSVLIAPIKGLGIFLVGLVFLINRVKFKSIKEYRIYILLLVLLSITCWLSYNIATVGISDILSGDVNTRYVEYADSEAFYLTDFLKYPGNTLKILYNSLDRWISSTLLCANTSLKQTYRDHIWVVFLMLIMYALPPSESGNNVSMLSWKNKLWAGLLLLVLSVVLCIEALISFGGNQAIVATVKPVYVALYLPFIPIFFRTTSIVYKGKWRPLGIILVTLAAHAEGIIGVLCK